MRWSSRATTAKPQVLPLGPCRRVFSVPTEPASVHQARVSTQAALAEWKVAPGSALVDAVLLVVSELVTNTVRHTHHRSPSAQVVITVGADYLVVGVADRDPHIPPTTRTDAGEGLRTVVDLAKLYGGGVTVAPVKHGGKIIFVHFRCPEALASDNASLQL
ncbi:ATP-binding protein [Streptomyces sp. NPDC047453]|uniref:ATP-binding protein n=1 Tax=Streptomyces sp. NPDC047453 TaxID=3154812 RepID=UPI0033DE1665